ncbi:hypothetical protein IE53DRAFT_371262, partial [Violaceomyces palustris]
MTEKGPSDKSKGGARQSTTLQEFEGPLQASIRPPTAKHFSPLALLGVCYTILNSWTAAAASLSVALPSGGPVAVVWGLVVSFIGAVSIALSMAEI